MILHLLTDDKFSRYPIQQFSSNEMQSEFVVIPNNTNKLECFVPQNDKCRIVSCPSAEFAELLNCWDKYQAVVFHGLFCPWTEDVIRTIPGNIKVAWVFWGGEIYSRQELNNIFLAPITKLAYNCHFLKKRKRNIPTWEFPKELYQKIDFCLTSIEEEFFYAKEYLNHQTIKHIWYSYYSLEDTVGSLITSHCEGNNVLFCNSAAIKNNMFDAVLLLAKRQNKKHLENRQIIMPLGYGEPWVKRSIKKIGKFLFGSKFCTINDFLPIEEYNRMMMQCSTLILPYWQPAAQGNIITGLWLGMRVYLSCKSMAYTHFKRIGAIVFSIEKDFTLYHYSRLSDAEVEVNRFVLRELYSKEHTQQSARDVVNTIT